MKLSDLMKIKGGKAELYTQLKMQPDVSLGMEPLKRERYFAVLYQFSDMVCADPAVSVPPNVLLICRTCSVELDFRKLRFALIRQQGVNEVKLRRIKLFDDNSFEVRTNDPAAEPQLIKRDQLQVFGLCMNFLKLFNN